MMKTMKKADLEAWEKAAKTSQDRAFRKEVKDLFVRGLMIVRKEADSDRIELIPTGSMRNKMTQSGMNIPLRSFKLGR